MKRWHSVRAAIFIGLISGFFTCNGNAAVRSYEQIKKSRELRICYTPWRGNDTEFAYPSPFLDLAVQFADSLKLRPKIKAIWWEKQFEAEDGKIHEGESYLPKVFASGDCDLLANNLAPVPWRQKLMNFNWLMSSKKLVVVRKADRARFKDLNDLKGMKTAVVPMTTYHSWLLAFNAKLPANEKITIKEVTSGGTTSELINGKVDFILLEATNAMFTNLHVSDKITWAFPLEEPIKVGWGFPIPAKKLLNLSEQYLKKSREESDLAVNAIFRRYFGVSLTEYDNLQFFLTTP